MTYTRLISELGDRLPGLAMASRTVGSPQIRNRGTVGGNLGSASPAGDAHPPLLASGAMVELSSLAGTRRLPVHEFYVGPKRSAMRKDELIAAFLVEPKRGPQQFSKVGTRNAMVIAVCSFALAIDGERRRIGTGIGSAAPTPVMAPDAESFLAGVLDERGLWEKPAAVEESALERFGQMVAAAASPIDDVRGTAAYRRHALAVMARRSFVWAWNEYRKAA
jgi:CO/xanthine dehydrogenase FAD-binding subunit